MNGFGVGGEVGFYLGVGVGELFGEGGDVVGC